MFIENKKLYVADFDPSAVTGDRTIATHTLTKGLPDNAVITDAWIDVITTFTSATDAATLAISTGQSAGDLVAAIAISDASNVWDAGVRGTLVNNPNLGADAAHDTALEVIALYAGVKLKLTANRNPTVAVAVEALTAGKLRLFIEYYVSA